MTLFNELKKYTFKPRLYAPSTNNFWDDEHMEKNIIFLRVVKQTMTSNYLEVNMKNEKKIIVLCKFI